jgi:hypothetical protein
MPLYDGSGRPLHRMTPAERAKIFIPFNPLKGFQEALREKEREVATTYGDEVWVDAGTPPDPDDAPA